MTGRDLFTYDLELMVQDEGDMEGGVAFERDFEEYDNEVFYLPIIYYEPPS